MNLPFFPLFPSPLHFFHSSCYTKGGRLHRDDQHVLIRQHRDLGKSPWPMGKDDSPVNFGAAQMLYNKMI
jgi:hypothetical protein